MAFLDALLGRRVNPAAPTFDGPQDQSSATDTPSPEIQLNGHRLGQQSAEEQQRLKGFARMQRKFLEVTGGPVLGSSNTINYDRLIQFQDAVSFVLLQCQSTGYKRGDFLTISRLALGTIPESPERRRLNEYFSCFHGRTERAFLQPPPDLVALNSHQRDILRQEVKEENEQLENILQGTFEAGQRHSLLEKMRRNALTTYCDEDAVLQKIHLETLTAAIEANDWRAAIDLWRTSKILIEAGASMWRESEKVHAALKGIVAAERTIRVFIEKNQTDHGAFDSLVLINSLERITKPLRAAAGNQSIQSTSAQVDEFAALRQKLSTLPVPSGLYSRVSQELEHFAAASREEKAVSRQLLYNLQRLPPLRQHASSAVLPLDTPTRRNAMRERLRATLDRHVIGHNSVKQKIIGEIIRMEEDSSSIGYTLVLAGASGVGKNTIALALAEALEREFFCVSCNGLQDSNTVLGDRKVFVGAEPGKAAKILMAQQRPGVILWDEVGKSGGQCQASIHQIIDFAQNKQIRDSYFGDVDLDFSRFIHVVAFNEGELVHESLGRRGASFSLTALTNDEKRKVLDKEIRIWSPKYFGEDVPVTLSADAREVLVDRHNHEGGARGMIEDAKSLLSRARELSDAGRSFQLNGQFVLEYLDNAVSVAVPHRALVHPGSIQTFDLTRSVVTERKNGQDANRWLWRVNSNGGVYQITFEEKSCDIRLCSGKPFWGFLGLALRNSSGAVQAMFTEKNLRCLKPKEDIFVILSTSFLDLQGKTETSAYDNMWKSGSSPSIRLALMPMSEKFSDRQAHASINAALQQKES